MRPRRRSRLALLLAVVALVPWVARAAPAQAQIGTPVDLGANEADVSFATTLSIITPVLVPAGASLIIVAASDGVNVGGRPPPDTATCSDSASHTYTTDVSRNDNEVLTTICATHRIATPLAAGASLTVTWSGGGAGHGQNTRARAFAVTGLASTPLDQIHSAVGSGTTPSSGTALVTTQANELLVGAILDEQHDQAGAVFSPGTNGTGNVCSTSGTSAYTAFPGVGSSNPSSLFPLYCIVSATGTYAANGLFGSGGTPEWQALLATYREASPTPTNTPTSTITTTPTVTSTPTPTSTSTPTGTITTTPTVTSTPTSTGTATATSTPTSTATATSESTATATSVATSTATPTATRTVTPTATSTPPSPSTLTVTPTGTLLATATATATPCILGDINCDGIVDIRDYGRWRTSFGQQGAGNPADLNRDDIVDLRDYGIWRLHFGEGTAPAAPRGRPSRGPAAARGPTRFAPEPGVAAGTVGGSIGAPGGARPLAAVDVSAPRCGQTLGARRIPGHELPPGDRAPGDPGLTLGG
jgi:hypothetical protein